MKLHEVERRKGDVYESLIPLIPRDFREDLKLLSLHSKRNAKLLKGVDIPEDDENLREVEVALKFLERALADPNAGVEDYYRYAMDIESALSKLYEKLSLEAKSEKTKRLFKWLAEISEEHFRILKRHLEMWKFMRENVEEEEIPEDILEQWFEDIDI